RHPLFQVALVFDQDEPETRSGVTWTSLDLDLGATPYDLTFRIRESAAGLEGWLEYNADIYEPDTIRRLRQHWMTLLQEIIAHPESRLSALPLLTPKEKEDLIALQSGPRVSYRTDCGVHHLFEEQAE